MPEFIMDSDGVVNGQTFDYLSPFLRGYIECMLFTETSHIPMTEWHSEESKERVREGQADGNIPADSGFGDIHPDTLIQMQFDCSDFQQKARHLLSQAYGHNYPARVIGDGTLPDSHRPAWDYDETQAGRDFWYTRNGHGVGFWDRELGDIGDKLADIARTFGETNAWFSEFEEDASPTGYGFVYIE